MSRRNRKRNRLNEDRGLALPAPLAALLVFGTAAAILVVWLSSRCDNLEKALRELDAEHTRWDQLARQEEYKLSLLESPRNIQALLARHDLPMVWPEERNIIRVDAEIYRAFARRPDDIPEVALASRDAAGESPR